MIIIDFVLTEFLELNIRKSYLFQTLIVIKHLILDENYEFEMNLGE